MRNNYNHSSNIIWKEHKPFISGAFKDYSASSRSFNVHVIFNQKLYIENSSQFIKEKLLIDFFTMQRKAYRYYKAVTEFEQGDLSEDDLYKIEDSCIINLKNDDVDEVKNKAKYLVNLLIKYYPEELEYLPYDELADLLQVSAAKLNLLLRNSNESD